MHSSQTPRRPACRRATAAVLLVAVLALAACSGDDEPAGGNAGALETRAASAATARSEDRSSVAPPPPGRQGGSAGAVEVKDPAARRTARGDVPAYVEIDGASVESNGGRLSFSVRLAGAVPAQTPTGVSLRVSFQVITDAGERLDLVAQAARSGWIVAGTAAAEHVPTTLRLGPKQVVLEIDRAEAGPGPFRWLASVAWSKGTSYGFDSAPERGYARSPNET